MSPPHDIDLATALMKHPRKYGWRGWFDPREDLLRVITGATEPWYARIFWECRRLWCVARKEYICRVFGHNPVDHPRFGRYCERCFQDV